MKKTNSKSSKVLHFLSLTMLIFTTCNSNDTAEMPKSESLEEFYSEDQEEQIVINEDSLWLSEFVAFRDAVYRKDLNAIKNFVDFPIESENIWYLAYSDQDIPENTDAPFIEKDFNLTYKNIFSSEFIDRLLKVKSKELFEYGEFETPSIRKEEVSIKIYLGSAQKIKRTYFHNVTLICCLTYARFFLRNCQKACT